MITPDPARPPAACPPGWLCAWEGALSAEDAAERLRDHGFVVVLAGLEAQALPEPLVQERAEAEQSASPQGFLVRRAIARAVGAMVLGEAAAALALTRDGLGAPQFAKGALRVSFSARAASAAIALGRAAVGVDLERSLPPGGIPRNLLRADECAALDALPESLREAAFLSLWRAKEAAVKALGRGFALPPESVRVGGALAQVAGFAETFALYESVDQGVTLATPSAR